MTVENLCLDRINCMVIIDVWTMETVAHGRFVHWMLMYIHIRELFSKVLCQTMVLSFSVAGGLYIGLCFFIQTIKLQFNQITVLTLHNLIRRPWLHSIAPLISCRPPPQRRKRGYAPEFWDIAWPPKIQDVPAPLSEIEPFWILNEVIASCVSFVIFVSIACIGPNPPKEQMAIDRGRHIVIGTI